MVRIKLENGFLRSDIQEAFGAFYSNPTLTKKSEDGTMSRYVCGVKCLLGTKSRYLMCDVLNDKAVVGTRRLLSDIDWETFQTREMDGKSSDMDVIEYVPEMDGLLTDKITKIQCNDQMCSYWCETLPLVVSILHTDKNESYNMDGTIITALEVYHTIISWRSSSSF